MATTPRHRSTTVPGGGGVITTAFLLIALLPPVTPHIVVAQAPTPRSPEAYFTRSDNGAFSLATAVILLAGISILLCLIIACIHQWVLAAERHATASIADVAESPSWRRRGGLDPELLEMFPTMTYAEAKAVKLGMGALECAVCLCEFEDDEALRLLPGCCHVFHPECIDAWLASHVTCPVCRADLAVVADSVASENSDSLPGSTIMAPASEADEPLPNHVIVVDPPPSEEEALEAAELEGGGSGRESSAELLHAYSIRHSPMRSGSVEHVDRFTLRLPEHVRRQVFSAQRLQRSASCAAVYPVTNTAGEGSSRAGGSRGWGWSVRLVWSDQWPSSVLRTISTTFTPWKWGDGADGSTKKREAESSSKRRFSAVRNSFECIFGGGASAAGGNTGRDERGRPQ
ncbi:E3 ubiquitin-protein ligase [Canna indica]|uniref:RING-type E3 ubiquitin transferase n=1 Tax=Canna indica TaxID=4628 RepID=A0AAQ3Q2P7_9LILI|nr:E3 ubiquitin-protein ligase [Canna indica]